ncbi:hypothetical protein [Dulcicalothrix desertica]|uniref:hypothetical protein n=1 Tax=Dulcicalothrix desertica TaxID=32056 RepID=UPI000F8D2CB2|nr:hypothetical protein [Dulcicalothrix desertica]
MTSILASSSVEGAASKYKLETAIFKCVKFTLLKRRPSIVDLGWGTGAPWAIGYILFAILLFYVDWQER